MMCDCEFLPLEDGGVKLYVRVKNGIPLKTVKQVEIENDEGLAILKER